MRSLGSVIFACWLGLALGCGEDAEEPGPAGAAGAGGASSLLQNEDELGLLACDAPEPCAEAGVQLVEASTHHLRGEETRCVLDALARRTPGRYRYETRSSHGLGHDIVRHLLLVTNDGSVQYVRTEHQAHTPPGVSEVRPDAGQRCTLKPPSYFEACREATLVSVMSVEQPPYWSCVFGDGSASQPSHLFWFESCVEQSPSACEPGGYGSTGSEQPDAGNGDAAPAPLLSGGLPLPCPAPGSGERLIGLGMATPHGAFGTISRSTKSSTHTSLPGSGRLGGASMCTLTPARGTSLSLRKST